MIQVELEVLAAVRHHDDPVYIDIFNGDFTVPGIRTSVRLRICACYHLRDALAMAATECLPARSDASSTYTILSVDACSSA